MPSVTSNRHAVRVYVLTDFINSNYLLIFAAAVYFLNSNIIRNIILLYIYTKII